MRFKNIFTTITSMMLVLLSNDIFSQNMITLSTKTETGEEIKICFKGKFLINDHVRFGTYDIYQISPTELEDSSLAIIFKGREQCINQYTFTLVSCREHEEVKNKNYKIGDTIECNVRTPDNAWCNYGCFDDENARQTFTLPCGCKRSIPISIIQTQLLIFNE